MKTPIPQDEIWARQRAFFLTAGLDAWRQNIVPHYATTNPRVARAVAELVLAFLDDQTRLGNEAPVTICELGCGSGRFAFHFLRHLTGRLRAMGVDPADRIRYVLTDIVPDTLDQLLAHPGLGAHVAEGVLDAALFDLTSPGKLHLLHAGTTLHHGTLPGALVILAAYVFDGVAPDIFRIADGEAERLHLVATPSGDDEGLQHLQFDVAPAPQPANAYRDEALDALLDLYCRSLTETHLLLPAASLHGTAQLAALSRAGSMLVSIDKGVHALPHLDGWQTPYVLQHGSVSLPVNHHAFAHLCTARGGVALTPSERASSLDVVCLLDLPQAEAHQATQSAFRRWIDDPDEGPDAYFRATKRVEANAPTMRLRALLDFLRQSLYDPHQLAKLLPRLVELAESATPQERDELIVAVQRCWNSYLPLGEPRDLAEGVAGLLYLIDAYDDALVFYRRSIEIYGVHAGTLFNCAACLFMLQRPDEALALLDEVLRHDPANEAARELRATCAAEIASAHQPSELL